MEGGQLESEEAVKDRAHLKTCTAAIEVSSAIVHRSDLSSPPPWNHFEGRQRLCRSHSYLITHHEHWPTTLAFDARRPNIHKQAILVITIEHSPVR